MGVKPCSRIGCLNIMCDRYSSNFGYICQECFEEGKNSNLTIEEFMKTLKQVDSKNFDKEFSLDKEF